MMELLLGLLNLLGLACWAEIKTENPKCTYYFGPFLTKKEANTYQNGYLEDLKGEGAKNIKITIKRCRPDQLTVFEETEEFKGFDKVVNFT